jgi:hypothetical protein
MAAINFVVSIPSTKMPAARHKIERAGGALRIRLPVTKKHRRGGASPRRCQRF